MKQAPVRASQSFVTRHSVSNQKVKLAASKTKPQRQKSSITHYNLGDAGKSLVVETGGPGDG